MFADVKDLTPRDYELFRRLVYAKSGINLGNEKTQLVRARLGKRMRKGGFKSFRDYYNHVEQDPTGERLCELLDAISTNTPHLFREERHFRLLSTIIDRWTSGKIWRCKHSALRMWSAGCSSGEEPYSMAMVAHDRIRGQAGPELKILATDLSVQMLSKAKLGLFDAHRVGTIPGQYRQRYLVRTQVGDQNRLQIIPELRELITFARFNLMTPSFPFRRGFDVIFCRNVMIYLDRPTQQTLIGKFAHILHDGGYLMIGPSESLSNIEHTLSYIEPTVYQKD